MQNCATCSKKASFRCNQCRLQYYCSAEHQKIDWNAKHRLICGKYKQSWNEGKVVSFYNSGSQIGRGGFGQVMVNPSIDPAVAIKYSKSRVSCASFSSEFKIASYIQKAAKSSGFEDKHAAVVKILADVSEISTLREGEIYCALVMDYIKRPNFEFGSDNALSYQAYVGADDPMYAHTSNGRGNYIGLDHVLKIMDVTQAELFVSMGRLIGFLHYVAEVDATDMEYIVGSSSMDGTLKIYAIDFDRVGRVENYQINIDTLVWSLSQETYFPNPTQSDYELFRKAYIGMASTPEKKAIAKKVIQTYEDDF